MTLLPSRHTAVSFSIGFMLFAAFWLGVFFRGFDEPTFAPAVLLILFSAIVLVMPGWTKGWAIPADASMRWLGGFWLWMIISLLWSTVPNVSEVFALTMGALPLLVFTLVQNPLADRRIAAMGSAMILALTLLALWAAFQFIVLGLLAGDRVHHPMLNCNNLGVVLAMGFFYALARFGDRGRLWQCVYGAVIVLMFFGLLTTQSRGGILGLALGSASYAVVCRKAFLRDWLPFCLLVCALVLTVGVFFMVLESRHTDLHIIGGAYGNASVENRFQLWRSGLRMLRDNIFPGKGLGTFYLTFPPYREFGDISDGFFDHIDPLQWGIEMSVVAPILFYGFTISVLLRTIKAVKAAGDDVAAKAAVIAPFAGMMVIMVNTHLDFDLYMLPANMLTAGLMAAWYRGTEALLGERRFLVSRADRKHWAVLVPVGYLLVIGAPVWTIRAGASVYEAEQSTLALDRGDFDSARVWADRTVRDQPHNYYRGYYLEALWRSMTLQRDFMAMEPAARETMYHEALDAVDESLRYNPWYIDALTRKALLHFIAYPGLDKNGMEEAESELERAVALNPVSFDARIGLAHVQDVLGAPNNALRTLQDAFQWEVAKQYAPPFYLQMVQQLQVKTGDQDGAKDMGGQITARQAQLQQRMQIISQPESWVNDHINALLNR